MSIDGQTWTLNPLCVQIVPGSSTELNNTMDGVSGHPRANHTSKSKNLKNMKCDLVLSFILFSETIKMKQVNNSINFDLWWGCHFIPKGSNFTKIYFSKKIIFKHFLTRFNAITSRYL